MSLDSSFEILDPNPQEIKRITEELGVSPLLARVLLNRGISKMQDAELFLTGSLRNMYDPFGMGDLPRAIDIIMEHIDRGDKILIHGDYDADGVTSTAIMIKALGRIGGILEYYIPDRFDEGYGFSEEAVAAAIEAGVKLIVTVDCGSSSQEIVELAHNAGIKVIITDHHEVPTGFPEADAFVNLKKPGETYPFRELSGAGVAFKLIQAIYMKLGRDDWSDFVDLAAVGTVADVVPLRGENRLIVKEGIQMLTERKHLGISQLLEIANVTRKTLSPWDISFIIAPKINAAGRLDDATVALKFLLEDNLEKARDLANQLCRMNEQRQQVENTIKEEIETMINTNPDLLSQPVWVFGSRNWHQGVIGIVASRFSQTFKRPVFLISIDERGTGRGSARCEENYDVYNALNTGYDLLHHFGGHRLAGGFTIDENNIDAFRERVSSPQLFSRVYKPLQVDAILEPHDINLNLAKEMEVLAPFGEGNPKPLFLARTLKIQSTATVGNQEQHLKVWVNTGVCDIKGIAFGKGNKKQHIWNNDLYYDLLFNLDVDAWNAIEEPSIKIQEILPPDNECLRIISGLDEVAIKPALSAGEERKDRDSWIIVDARKVINRRKYLKILSKLRRRSMVLTRNRKQMEVLAANLRQEGVICSEQASDGTEKKVSGAWVFVSPYERNRMDPGPLDFEEVILYHPPFLWEHFSPEIFSSPALKRVHLLFNDADVQREAVNQEILAPDRDRLLKIYAYLKKIAGSANFASVQPRQLATAIKDELIGTVTIQIAFKIFHEIGLVEFRGDEKSISFHLLKNEKQDLENSPMFRSQTRKKEVFYRLKALYSQPFLSEFAENVRNIVQDQLQKQ